MKIDLEQTAKILNKTSDEVLFIVQDDRLNAELKKDGDMLFNEDGTVKFIETDEKDVVWEFDLDEVLELKQSLDVDLDGQLTRLLEE